MTTSESVVSARPRAWAHVALFAMLASLLSLVPSGLAEAQSTQVTVEPIEHNRLLRSPGIGMQDFVGQAPTASELAACSYDNTVNAVGLRGGSLYIRLLWNEIEPVEGQYAWSMLDRLFECATERDQTIDFRVMLSWPGAGEFDCWNDPGENDDLDHGIPCWLVRKGVNELEHDGVGGTEATYIPDWEDATLRSDHRQLITALGARYGSHPRLNSVDIGSVGFWGEWHTYPNDELMPTRARRKAIIDLYASSFPDTPLVVLAEVFKNQINGDTVVTDHLNLNHAGRFGWRGDSWGQTGHHVYDYEPIHLANPDLWKTGPVAMEVTGIMDWWDARMGGDDYGSVLPLDTSVNDALTWHSSLAHNKAANIPTEYVNDGDPTQKDLRTLARRMGTRLVLDELTYSNQVTAGETTQITSTWYNRGVAPLYHDFRVWYRLRDASGTATAVRTGTTFEGFLPTGLSPEAKRTTFRIPAGLAAGQYRLDIAVAHKQDIDLKMPLAVENTRDDNWFELGPISVEGNSGDSRLTGITATAVANSGDASNIVDGDPDTAWDNGGVQADGVFTLDLGERTAVTRIRYQDDFARQVQITLDDVPIFTGWTPPTGENVFADIELSPPPFGRQLRFELLLGNWIVPEEIEVYGSPTAAADFTCEAATGVLTWTDIDSNKYQVYRSLAPGQPFRWLGRTIGSPATTTFTDQGTTVDYRYQIRDGFGVERADCTVSAEPFFECNADAGVVTWTDVQASKYRIYRSTNDGQTLRWLGRTIGSPAPATFTDEATTAGDLYAVQHSDNAPRVVCVDTTEGLSRSVLLDMHNNFLLGQNHVWSSLNGNQGSLDAVDKLVQVFEFSGPVAKGATTAEFSTQTAITELDPGELIVYGATGGTRRSSRVVSVTGSTATFSPPIQRAQSSGAKFWSLYGDGAHPNKIGYGALADFALEQFTSEQLGAMHNKSHLFLGDSWMEPGPAGNLRLGDRIAMHFDGSITSQNKAVGGRTSGDVLDALPIDFPVGESVDYVWLIVGTNDYFQQVPAADFVDNVAQIVEYVETQGAVAIVINSSVGLLDGTLADPQLMLNLSREYVAAQEAWFAGR